MFQHNNNNTRGNYYILPVITLRSFAKTKRNAQLANNEKNANAVEKTDRKKKTINFIGHIIFLANLF